MRAAALATSVSIVDIIVARARGLLSSSFRYRALSLAYFALSVVCCFLVSLAMRMISALYSAAGRRRRVLQASSRVLTARANIGSVASGGKGERMLRVDEVEGSDGVIGAGEMGGVSVRGRGGGGRLDEVERAELETVVETTTCERTGEESGKGGVDENGG